MHLTSPKPASTRVYAAFVGRVFVLARSLTSSRASLDQLHDLMDAVHNVHLRFTDEARWDEAFFLEAFVKSYDDKWRVGTSLRALFDDCVKHEG